MLCIAVNGVFAAIPWDALLARFPAASINKSPLVPSKRPKFFIVASDATLVVSAASTRASSMSIPLFTSSLNTAWALIAAAVPVGPNKPVAEANSPPPAARPNPPLAACPIFRAVLLPKKLPDGFKGSIGLVFCTGVVGSDKDKSTLGVLG